MTSKHETGECLTCSGGGDRPTEAPAVDRPDERGIPRGRCKFAAAKPERQCPKSCALSCGHDNPCFCVEHATHGQFMRVSGPGLVEAARLVARKIRSWADAGIPIDAVGQAWMLDHLEAAIEATVTEGHGSAEATPVGVPPCKAADGFICEWLDCPAHSVDVGHRDLKPENPVLCPRCRKVKHIQACAVSPCPCSCHLIERVPTDDAMPLLPEIVSDIDAWLATGGPVVRTHLESVSVRLHAVLRRERATDPAHEAKETIDVETTKRWLRDIAHNGARDVTLKQRDAASLILDMLEGRLR